MLSGDGIPGNSQSVEVQEVSDRFRAADERLPRLDLRQLRAGFLVLLPAKQSPCGLLALARTILAAGICATGTVGIFEALFGGHRALYERLALAVDRSAATWYAFPAHSVLFGVELILVGFAVLRHRLWWALLAPGFIVAMRASLAWPSDGNPTKVGFNHLIWAGKGSFFLAVMVIMALASKSILKAEEKT